MNQFKSDIDQDIDEDIKIYHRGDIKTFPVEPLTESLGNTLKKI